MHILQHLYPHDCSPCDLQYFVSLYPVFNSENEDALSHVSQPYVIVQMYFEFCYV